MKKSVLIIFIAFIFIISGFAQKEEQLDCEVRPVSSRININGNQLFYALPRNIIRIEIEVERKTQFQGPYREFASKYLGISDGIIFGDDEYYTIKAVKFHRLSMPDSAHYYSVTCGGFSGFPMLQLNSDGVIIGCNLPYTVEGYDTKFCALVNPEPESEDYIFDDMGDKPFVIEKNETLYRMVETDSTPVRVSYTQTKMVETTSEMNAKEAADFIRKLRKRRLKLVAGIKDEVVDADGDAIDDMIKELRRLENKYLELFIGKTINSNFTYYFDFEPDELTDAEQQIVGWFSRQNGLISGKPDIRKSEYKPLIIHSSIIGKVPQTQIQVMDQSQKTPTAIKYGLYYRIPGRIDLMLKYLNQVLAKQEWEVAQKGQVLPLPVTYLNDQSYAVEFYPESGSIKRIFKVE